jgi:hypothetical protein
VNPKNAAPGSSWQSAPGGDLKERDNAFSPEISEAKRGRQDDVVPDARAQIIVGAHASFIYIKHCPLCGLEHTHGFDVHGADTDLLATFSRHNGHRATHCFCQGPGRVARRILGERRTVIVYPSEWRGPCGDTYRLSPSGPACFTAEGIRSPAARRAMVALARRGVATSLKIWTPRRSCFRGFGDR